MEISQYKIKTNTFTAELDEPLDKDLRTLITIEADIYAVEDRDLQNGEADKIYKAKLVGSTIVKQGDKKPILAKSKRSDSQKWRLALRAINDSDGYYERFMPKLIARAEEVVELIENT
jgi:hypothetical protein